MKKLLSLLILVVLAFSLTGCGGGKTATTAGGPEKEQKTVAILTLIYHPLLRMKWSKT